MRICAQSVKGRSSENIAVDDYILTLINSLKCMLMHQMQDPCTGKTCYEPYSNKPILVSLKSISSRTTFYSSLKRNTEKISCLPHKKL